MTYTAEWTNSNAQGRLDAGVHFVRDDDADEQACAVNRRRRLVYLAEQDFSSQIGAGKSVRVTTIAAQLPPPFKNFRSAVTGDILEPAAGGLGGNPASPSGMDWLWPVADADENKILVASSAGAGQVALFDKLNATGNWTDLILTAGQNAVRAVHFNELRQAVEWIRRGRWRLPVYFSGGIFSQLPDTPWIGSSIANNGTNELRSIGFLRARTGDSPPLGLTNVTARSATIIELTTDTTCDVEIYHCLRAIDFTGDPPTWNEYDPSASGAWASPGGTGAGDATYIGSMSLTADVTGQLSNTALVSAVQAMIDGAEQNFLVRRSDTGYETVGITGELTVEFDLDTPPN
ncbi:MAG: hypothetical protein SVV80_13535 [Planctomycetota bacterium]|nr:hypothetical protein [Planctomycetota bacterium]